MNHGHSIYYNLLLEYSPQLKFTFTLKSQIPKQQLPFSLKSSSLMPELFHGTKFPKFDGLLLLFL